jgi:hypothetical protein
VLLVQGAQVSCSEAERILAARYGNGLVGGVPKIVATVERVIDDRPCEPLRPEDCEHHEAPGPPSGVPLYDNGSGSGGGYDMDSPPPSDAELAEVSQFVARYLAQSSTDAQHNDRCSWRHGPQGERYREFEALLPSLRWPATRPTPQLTESVASMPSSWWQHFKWTLQRRWPRVFGWLTVFWTQSWRVR